MSWKERTIRHLPSPRSRSLQVNGLVSGLTSSLSISRTDRCRRLLVKPEMGLVAGR